MALDRLQVKLFLAIAGANALLAAIAYLVFAASFDRGLAETLARSDRARLDSFAASLGELYGREGGWASLGADRDRWSALRREALGLPPRPPAADGTLAPLPGQPREPTDGTQPPSPAQPRELPLTVDPRLMLFDVERKLVAGAPELADKAALKPIERQGATVGYLGAVPRLERIASLERVVSAQQHWRFAAIALGMLGAALLLGAGLAHWLTRRVRALASGTEALMRGDYDVRLPVAGHDELDRLAGDFNSLAATLAATRRARSQWIADIAHELRTPLAVLRGEIEALQDGVRPLDAASLASLAQEVAHLGRLVEDLHTLSLSDLGALSYHKEPLDVAELAGEAVAMQRRALDEKGLARRARARAGGDRARRRDAARAGVRESPAEHPALHRCAGPHRRRGAARGRPRRARLAGLEPGRPARGPPAPDRAPVPRRGFAQPRRRRLRARARDRQGDRGGARRHARGAREPLGGLRLEIALPAARAGGTHG